MEKSCLRYNVEGSMTGRFANVLRRSTIRGVTSAAHVYASFL